MFVSKLFTYLTCAYLKSKKCFNMKFTTSYFHMKTKTLADFQIYIGVPLRVSFNASKKLERYNKVIPKLYALFYS